MGRCFISHDSSDRPFVQQHLVGLLSALGQNVWLAPASIPGGALWESEIRAGLDACDWFILIMSRASVESQWVKDELSWALEHRTSRFVPIMIEPCDPSAFHLRLPRLQYIDCTTGIESGRNRLIELLVDAVWRPPRRAEALNGTWNGRAHQERGPDGGPIEYPVELTMRVRQEIKGVMSVGNPLSIGPHDLRFDITAGFSHEKFVQLSYTSSNPAYIQFGSAVLEMDDRADELEGMFVGYGAFSKRIINGRMQFRRASDGVESEAVRAATVARGSFGSSK